jgi:predicted O-methyltransferase YrrM
MNALARKFHRANRQFKALIPMIAKYGDEFARIPVFEQDAKPLEPYWYNGMIPGLDASALYAFIAERKPALYVEIGSGHSTKFAVKACTKHSPHTRIVSIDPEPDIDVEALCHEAIRSRLQDVPVEFFAKLQPNDMVFFDGSHISHMNSDVTRFLLDIVPGLPRGVLVQIHDIFLPDDYPREFGIDRGYNEQYVLAAYLLGGGKNVKPVFPCHYVTQCEWSQPLHKAWETIQPKASPQGPGFEPWGGSFWMLTT